jgi:hypothetical protein
VLPESLLVERVEELVDEPDLFGDFAFRYALLLGNGQVEEGRRVLATLG